MPPGIIKIDVKFIRVCCSVLYFSESECHCLGIPEVCTLRCGVILLSAHHWFLGYFILHGCFKLYPPLFEIVPVNWETKFNLGWVFWNGLAIDLFNVAGLQGLEECLL